jgi:hypothetical protein
MTGRAHDLVHGIEIAQQLFKGSAAMFADEFVDGQFVLLNSTMMVKCYNSVACKRMRFNKIDAIQSERLQTLPIKSTYI